MSYLDGMMVPVPADRRNDYLRKAREHAELFKAAGALQVLESWGDDIPDGQSTDMKRAIALQPGEAVVFSFILWPSKAVRDAAWPELMQDPRMAMEAQVFNMTRMIHGGFDVLYNSGD